MPEGIVNLLIQIPLVGIFIWFILERDKRSDTNEQKRDEQWREFLAEQREASNLAITRLTDEIKTIGQEVNRLGGMLSAHDIRSQERNHREGK